MKKIIAIVLCALMMTAVLCGCTQNETKGKLVLGTSADYPPFEFHMLDADGKDVIVGIDISVAQSIAVDMGLELDNLARMLTMSRDYARAKGFKGDFYIEPKAKEPTSHQYDFDTATAVAFCKKYGLDKDFRMNIEHNHALLAGHTMQHELRTARINGMFGSVDANQGDPMIGWDVDMFPSNVYDATFAMYEVLKAGGFTNGGLNFDAKVRRASYTPEDIALAHITGMDTYAMGLRCAAAIIEDGRLDKFIEERYASWNSGIGADIIAGKATLESLEAYALNAKNPVVASGKQEYLENMINSIMFSL